MMIPTATSTTAMTQITIVTTPEPNISVWLCGAAAAACATATGVACAAIAGVAARLKVGWVTKGVSVTVGTVTCAAITLMVCVYELALLPAALLAVNVTI